MEINNKNILDEIFKTNTKIIQIIYKSMFSIIYSSYPLSNQFMKILLKEIKENEQEMNIELFKTSIFVFLSTSPKCIEFLSRLILNIGIYSYSSDDRILTFCTCLQKEIKSLIVNDNDNNIKFFQKLNIIYDSIIIKK